MALEDGEAMLTMALLTMALVDGNAARQNLSPTPASTHTSPPPSPPPCSPTRRGSPSREST
eukprot:scaffold50282_cov44-Phaeocystis_antarctica.AAC.2